MSPAKPAPRQRRQPKPGGKGPGKGKNAFSTLPIRPLKLRHILFGLLLVSGIIPLLISAYHLIGTNKELLETQQTELLTQSAQGFARLLSDNLARTRHQLAQLNRGLLATPDQGSVVDRLRSPWANDYLVQSTSSIRGLTALWMIDENGAGLSSPLGAGNGPVEEKMAEAIRRAVSGGTPVYRYVTAVSQQGSQTPSVVLAVPERSVDGRELVVAAALLQLPLEGITTEDMFLIDGQGQPLWSSGGNALIEEAVLGSQLVKDFLGNRFSVASQQEININGQVYRVLARAVPVDEADWGVVAHKATDAAFQQVRDMVKGTVLTSLVVVALALFFAVLATRWLSAPIQRLAETSHEIAAGNFDRRVPTGGLTLEVADLAEDFNRMSDYVENYIAQLRSAAQANRQLFISSIRAFAAAIDAKDPYTRGHSERVARFSRAIAHYLGLPKDIQERVWISAVLHDIGKIGVEDKVLLKMGRLTDEEFDKMKQHPVIGADIVEPIHELRMMLPGIRWHHEAWNGSGYPDNLKGEEIPLMARIIGVADTFDAITTNRPYQKASPPEYALQTIKKLTGTKFDAKIVTAFLLAWEAGHIKMDTPRAVDAPPQPAPETPGGPSQISTS